MDPSISGIVLQFDPRLAAIFGWLILMAKFGVDWLKTAATLPKWGPPAACFGAVLLLAILAMLALDIPITVKLSAQAIIMSIIGTAIAIASTVLQARTNPSVDTMTAAAIVDDIQRRIQAADALGVTHVTTQERVISGADVSDDDVARVIERANVPRNPRPTETTV